MSATIPPALAPLLERPLFASLGTVRPDDTVQVNPMWFEYDGEHVRFTHTNKRGKFRNLQRNPSMSLLLIDDENPQATSSCAAGSSRSSTTPRATSTSGSAAATATRTRSRRRTRPTGSCSS